MQDAASGRSPVFGVTRTAQALYVPDLSQGSGLDYGLVHFATQGDLDRFKYFVNRFNLKPGLITKYSNTNRSTNRLDLQVSQYLPSPIEGHHFKVVADIRNVLNLLDSHWGGVREFNDVNTVTRVSCADVTGSVVPTTSAACPRYSTSSRVRRFD